MNKIRLDFLLVGQGLAPSQEKAQALIISGQVKVNGQAVTKPGTLISPDSALAIEQSFPYVSRAGAKLARALQVFRSKPGELPLLTLAHQLAVLPIASSRQEPARSMQLMLISSNLTGNWPGIPGSRLLRRTLVIWSPPT